MTSLDITLQGYHDRIRHHEQIKLAALLLVLACAMVRLILIHRK